MGKENKNLESIKKILEHLKTVLQIPISIRLWDNSRFSLSSVDQNELELSIKSPYVLSSILRKPTFENILIQYATGQIDYHGGTLFEIAEIISKNKPKKIFKKINKTLLLKNIVPLIFSPKEEAKVQHKYLEDETGRKVEARDNKKFIQFHYDLGNDFYKLFLDPEMLYSCAYFHSLDESLEKAQINKLDMICKKLRLKKGESFLDIGSGWGALLCYAAQKYGVKSYGVTLSKAQYEFSKEKIKSLGLEDQVKVELRDYESLDGKFDKISSIGMYEHVGIKNFPKYFGKICDLLNESGIFLNHGIVRRAKASKKAFNKISPGNRLILKYIFPGSELDHIGHTIESMEHVGFEVHDVENWRLHYARTCKLWCERLQEKESEAIEIIGKERFRMWLAYLASVSLAFEEGNIRIYQTVATKRKLKGYDIPIPLTRSDLYTEHC